MSELLFVNETIPVSDTEVVEYDECKLVFSTSDAQVSTVTAPVLVYLLEALSELRYPLRGQRRQVDLVYAPGSRSDLLLCAQSCSLTELHDSN